MSNTDISINLLTLAEVASILKVSKLTVHRMVKKGRLPAIKVGGRWRISESRLEEWLEQEEVGQALGANNKDQILRKK